MSDDQGTVRPDDPTRYAMSFDTDGRATLRLDCNRALGAYKATPSSEGTSGELSFEPLAATRATCGPGSLEPRLVKALPNVRSYLVKDGRLHLSLMADGGILTWMPAR